VGSHGETEASEEGLVSAAAMVASEGELQVETCSGMIGALGHAVSM